MGNRSTRRFPRISTDLDAVVVTRSGNKEVHPIVIAELSQGGAFLKGDVPLGMGRVVVLEGKYPWGEFKVPCRVLYQRQVDDKHGMGVRFEIGEADPPDSLLGYINQKLPEAVLNIMEDN